MATTHWDILKPPILKHAGTKPRNLHSGVLECQGIVSEVLPVHTKSNCVDKDLLFLSTIYNPFWLWSGASRTYISTVIYYIYTYLYNHIHHICIHMCFLNDARIIIKPSWELGGLYFGMKPSLQSWPWQNGTWPCIQNTRCREQSRRSTVSEHTCTGNML